MARSLLLPLLRCVAMVMPAMTMMHEQVHQRAGQQDQVRQDTEQVGAVLRKQQKPRNGEKSVEHPPAFGNMMRFALIGHGSPFFIVFATTWKIRSLAAAQFG
jgi:hypothetical protein